MSKLRFPRIFGVSYAVLMLCFFFPFLLVKCGGYTQTVSGVELASGDLPANTPLESENEKIKADPVFQAYNHPHWALLAAVLVAFAGLVLGLVGRGTPLLGVVLSLLGFGAMTVFIVQVHFFLPRSQAGAYIEVRPTLGAYLVTVGYAALAVLSAAWRQPAGFAYAGAAPPNRLRGPASSVAPSPKNPPRPADEPLSAADFDEEALPRDLYQEGD